MIAAVRSWLTRAVAVREANEEARELARTVQRLTTLAAIEEGRADREEAAAKWWRDEAEMLSNRLEAAHVEVDRLTAHIERLTRHVGALARIARMLNGVRSFYITTEYLRDRYGRVRAHRAAMHRAAPCQVPGCEWCSAAGGAA